MPLRAHGPQPCVSANSTTTACTLPSAVRSLRTESTPDDPSVRGSHRETMRFFTRIGLREGGTIISQTGRISSRGKRPHFSPPFPNLKSFT